MDPFVPPDPWLAFQDWDQARQGPTKRIKRQTRERATDTEDSATASFTQMQSCGSAIDIEDLGEIRCANLICAPIVPSQSVEDYPDTALQVSTLFQSFPGGITSNNTTSETKSQGKTSTSRSRRSSSRKTTTISIPIPPPPPPPATTPPLAANPRINNNHLYPHINDTNTNTILPSNSISRCINTQKSPLPSSSSSPFTQQLLPAPESQYTSDLLRQEQPCLLECVNPGYFDRQQSSRWHSSMEPVPDTSEMTSIDPESAQDFTEIYSTAKPTYLPEMSRPGVPEQELFGDFLITGLERESVASSSSDGSLDALLRPVQVHTIDLVDTATDLNGLEDVNLMFNWDEACANLVDDQIPGYQSSDAGTPPIMKFSGAFDFPTLPGSSTARRAGSIVHSRNNSVAYSMTAAGSSPILGHEEHQDNLSPAGSCLDEDDDGPTTACHNCGVTKTPLWRRTPDKRHSLCNACGLYLKQYKTMRPLGPRNRSQLVKKDEENTVCSNCEATKTSLWRKDENGNVICNACGLYHKLHGKTRPITMRKEKISRRKRYRNLPPEIPQSQALVSPILSPITPAAIAIPEHHFHSSHSSPLTGPIVA